MAESDEALRNWGALQRPPSYAGETEAIENALYALQALENCLKAD